MEKKTYNITEGQYLIDVFKHYKTEKNAIPTNCIFDKTIPGLGATHSEILAHRNSIIIEPNIPVITGKCGNKKLLLPLYENTTDNEIKTYLSNKTIQYKKILCTPESYMRIKPIAQDLSINLHREYFCLFDECEKITQDIDFRELIALPILDFFDYTSKAFVSATPLQIRNPYFKAHGFHILKIKPLYDHRKKLELIVTNRYDKTVIAKLEELKDSNCICIFLNSANGLIKLVDYLNRKGITDYKVFCSRKSLIKLKGKKINNSFEKLQSLAKYNFFTSRFFSAVDIVTDKKPDILILTDLNEAKYTRIDPKTNAIQIYGRFRKGPDNEQPFKSLTHITNVDPDEKILPESEIESYIAQAKIVYDALKNRRSKETDIGRHKALTDDLNKVSYNRFIKTDENVNYFSIDNFYDDERVKACYLSVENLKKAYDETGHFFEVEPIIKKEIIDDKIILKLTGLSSDIETRKLIVNNLDDLHKRGLSEDEIDWAINIFRDLEPRHKAALAIYIIEAYNILGSEAIINAKYLKTSIDLLLKNHQKDKNKNAMRSEVVKDAIKLQVPECKEYLLTDVIARIERIFVIHGITEEVKFPRVQYYYGVDKLKCKGKEGWVKLRKFQIDEEE